jgi:hypothetical protein
MTTSPRNGTHVHSAAPFFSALAVVLVLASGCGDSVSEAGTSGGTGGGGASGAGGAGGAGGGGSTCTTIPPFAGQFGWTYQSPDGAYHDCSPDTEGASVDTVGAIAAGSIGGTWLIDECPPGADCPPSVHTLTIGSDPALEPPPMGTFVRLTASIEHLSGPPPINCRQTLVVTNEPGFGGATNPTASDGLPWLDPIDTEDGVFQAAYAPFCSIDHPDPGCSWTETYYSAEVTYTPFPESKVGGLMGGDSGALTVPDGSGQGVPFMAHYALMSNGNCENPGNSVVWVRRTP